MWLYRLNTEILGSTLGLYWRLKLRGAVEAIPREGPLLVAANHTSLLDPWFISMPFPRPIRYLMSEEWYNRNRAWRAFFRAYGTIPVSPRDPRATIDTVSRVVENGDTVGIFPEGHVSPDGRLQRFRSGLYRIASRTHAPVVPVGIRGAFRSLPRTRRFPRPTPVSIHVGEPIIVRETSQEADSVVQRRRAFEERLLREICRLSDQEERIVALLPKSSREAATETVAGAPVSAEAT